MYLSTYPSCIETGLTDFLRQGNYETDAVLYLSYEFYFRIGLGNEHGIFFRGNVEYYFTVLGIS